MLFNSFQFLIFFPTVTIAYFLLPHRYRWALILAASCYFYMAFIPKYILILAITIMVDYIAGIGLETFTGKKRRWLLFASLLANIGMLGFFKYFNFANVNLVALADFLGWNYPIKNLSIILPIGLSFHTFQSLSYTIEVYRGRQKAERHLGYLATYVMFYPQLVAGPIERPQNILHQLHANHKFDYQRVTDGLKWMAWGMFKKVVIADRMALFANPIYNDPGSYSGPALLLAILAFTIQIYCDFSGYSDIALGSAQVMGIKLMKNFDHPYFSKSIPEFWRRWHISLSTWFRDYLYIPLGGNRTAKPRWAFNIFITFLISGLWHGANWTFIIWGALHGILILFFEITKTFWKKLSNLTHLDRFPKAESGIAVFSTFTLVSFSWIFFRAANLSDAILIIKGLFDGWGNFMSSSNQIIAQSLMGLSPNGLYPFAVAPFQVLEQLTVEPRGTIFLTFFALVVLLFVELKQFRGNFMESIKARPVYIRMMLYASLIALTLILGTIYVSAQQSFIYFQF